MYARMDICSPTRDMINTKSFFNHLLQRVVIATPKSASPGAPIIKAISISHAFSCKTEYKVNLSGAAKLLKAYKKTNPGAVIGTDDDHLSLHSQYLSDFVDFLNSFPLGFFDQLKVVPLTKVNQLSCHTPKHVLDSEQHAERNAETILLRENGFKGFPERVNTELFV
jgi:hypothetical protein